MRALADYAMLVSAGAVVLAGTLGAWPGHWLTPAVAGAIFGVTLARLEKRWKRK